MSAGMINSHVQSFPPRAPRLREIALAAIASACRRADLSASADLARLDEATSTVCRDGRSVEHAIEEALRRPAIADAALTALAADLQLSRLELLAVALAAGVEEDPLIGHAVARLQAPIGGSRPTLGFIARALASPTAPAAQLIPSLLNGSAIRSGLVVLGNAAAPLPEWTLMVPAGLCVALAGEDGFWPGIEVGTDEAMRIPLPPSIVSAARRHAAALDLDPHSALVLRSGSPAEGRTVASVIARALDRRAAFIQTDQLAGVVPWLLLRRLTPVFCHELSPGERRRLPRLPGYALPVLAISGPDGSFETNRGAAADWTLPIPGATERQSLWSQALGAEESGGAMLSRDLAGEYRHGAGRIAHLARLARHHARLDGRAHPVRADIIAASWTGEAGGLDALAEPLRAPVSDGALIAGAALRRDLDTLLMRCRLREDLAEGLGASARTRYRSGVKALFTGPSGTGKTLAAGWMATRLGLPLYRVDLASVTSKYIGETEKNLSQLLARAEQSEVILLFDEADSLFGRRTDISDANDRFANAQTNYLLQRIENYDGIVLLTSNSQARFDEAFARRLDHVIDFPPPGPEERRALWLSHIGHDTTLQPADLNRLAMLLDLNGGHIRNATLAAAVLARGEGRCIEIEDLLAGADVELRKAGRQMPIQLRTSRAPTG